MIFAVTGHRPDKITGGYSDDARMSIAAFARSVLISQKVKSVDRIYTGMAQGWDQAVAEACIELSIPFTAAIPCTGQEKLWPIDAQNRYRRLLSRAAKIHVVSPGIYDAAKMQIRNEFMCDRAQRLIALWNRSNGGTRNCVLYANEIGLTIANVWPDWVSWQQKKRVELSQKDS